MTNYHGMRHHLCLSTIRHLESLPPARRRAYLHRAPVRPCEPLPGARRRFRNPESLRLLVAGLGSPNVLRVREAARRISWDVLTVRRLLDWGVEEGHLEQMSNRMFRVRHLPLLLPDIAFVPALAPLPEPEALASELPGADEEPVWDEA